MEEKDDEGDDYDFCSFEDFPGHKIPGLFDEWPEDSAKFEDLYQHKNTTKEED